MEDPMGDSRLTRRGFLTTSFSGLVTTGIIGLRPGLALAHETSEMSNSAGDVIYCALGRMDLEIPVVSMGVMNSKNPEIVRASYEMGIRHFDTAATYQHGRNEQMVGNVIRLLGVRDKVVIATKEFSPAQRRGITPKQIRGRLIDLCEGSLKRLNTDYDYIDILYIHSVSSAADVNDEEVMEAMALLKKHGKVRFVGVTTYEGMTEIINAVAENGFYDVVLTAINVSMADGVDLMKGIENAASREVGIMAMKTQAGGQRLPNPETLRRFSSSAIATACLKWVMRNENIATAIPGFDNYEHMHEDFSVARNLEYTPQEREFLSDNSIRLSMGFCRQCRQCLPTCPKGADVPTLMRAHMYAARYANFHHARAVLDEIPESRGIQSCDSCAQCTAECAHTVDIHRRIDELKAMYA
jgi:predicted aldo/keto reductase-like oxidoreductase